jgi:hypothetical protein
MSDASAWKRFLAVWAVIFAGFNAWLAFCDFSHPELMFQMINLVLAIAMLAGAVLLGVARWIARSARSRGDERPTNGG